MGREKFNKLTDEQKEKIRKKILAKMDELTKMKEKFEQEFDFFDAINDEGISCFECNGKCMDCSLDDLKKCMQNFRMGNLFILKKLRLYEQGMEKYMEGLEVWSQTFLKWLQSDADIESEIKKTKTKNEVIDMYS